MRYLTLLFALILSSSIFGQKIEYDKKTGIVSLEETKLFKIDREGGKDYYFEVKNLEAEKLLVISYKYGLEYTDGWFEFAFLDSGKKVAVSSATGASKKRMAKFIYDNDLIVDGKLDENAVAEFILTKEYTPPVSFQLGN